MTDKPNILILMADQLSGVLFPDGPADCRAHDQPDGHTDCCADD